MESKSHKRDQVIFYLSIGCVTYFSLLYLNNNYFKFDHVLIGVIHEMTMGPILGTVPILVFVSAKGFYAKQYQIISYSFFSLLISSITLTVLIVSFWKSFSS